MKSGYSFSHTTAFAVGPNRFIMNLHSMNRLLKQDSINDITLQQEGSSSHLTIRRIIAVSAIYDLVLFETKKSVSHYADIVNGRPYSYEDLVIFGYVDGKFVEIKKTGSLLIGILSIFFL